MVKFALWKRDHLHRSVCTPAVWFIRFAFGASTVLLFYDHWWRQLPAGPEGMLSRLDATELFLLVFTGYDLPTAVYYHTNGTQQGMARFVFDRCKNENRTYCQTAHLFALGERREYYKSAILWNFVTYHLVLVFINHTSPSPLLRERRCQLETKTRSHQSLSIVAGGCLRL